MKKYTVEEISSWIVRKLSVKLNLPASAIRLDKDILDYGLDSMEALGMVGEIEALIGVEIPATSVWDYPTISQLAQFIHDEAPVI
ncbi:acyl carrier protein [Chitinophaga sp. HK235]|uniref:acyl carrier protein n=1 Tax=Chitinophaga sp. HK235 TaxID=2952571 RepID=UPI001BA6A5AC|nr:acyl carrier protein [Chitinophaga sp. HK235]